MKGIIVSVFLSQSFDFEYALEIDQEMRLLSESASIEILNEERFIIKNRSINAGTFFSKGKLEQIKNIISKFKDDFSLVFNIDFSPTQIKNLQNFFEKNIITKTQLVYQIFLARANSKAAKIQLELANLKYIKSRLTGSYENFDRIRGGIGLKGPGETKLEVDRRTISKKIKNLQKQLKDIEKNLIIQSKKRQEEFIFTLTGYTNAGKTSLLNLLTKSNQYSDNALFTTVNVKSRQLYLKNGNKIIISDTIGFIRELPIHLVESFKTTLLEIKYSTLIGIVVDSSSKFYKDHINVVEDMLKTLKSDHISKIIIFNKIDLLSSEELENLKIKNNFEFNDLNTPIFYISTIKKTGINELLDFLNSFYDNNFR